MSNPKDSGLGGFEPFNDLHAIQSCTLTLGFAPATNGGDFFKVARQAGAKLELGVGAPSYGVGVTFDPSAISLLVNRPAAQQPAIGIEFSTINNEGNVTYRVLALADAIVVQTTDYLRWRPFYEQASRAFRQLLPAYGLGRLINVKTEYVDRFECREPEGSPDVWKLLSRNSMYLTPGVVDNGGPWHSHSGHFVKAPSGAKRLHKVNIDVRDNDGSRNGTTVARSVTVISLVQDFFEPHLAVDAADAGIPSIEEQHLELKEMLADIITVQAASRIGLR